MPPQTPSDQGYPEQALGSESPERARRNRASADVPQPQSSSGAGLPPAAPPPPAAPRLPTSRRSVLRGVVGVGAVGIAAAAGAGAVFEFDRPSAKTQTLMPAAKPVAMAPMAPTAMAGPLVVYIADTTTGVIDVFGGTGATQIRNPALVNQLLANLKLA
jgi:hypothetical protein